VTDDELRLLASRYYDPETKLYNFLQFHSDIGKLGGASPASGLQVESAFGDKDKEKSANLESVFNKLRVIAFRDGIRTTEFFQDHDKLRSGLITTNQFVCGLSLCCGKSLQLSRDGIQLLVDHYQTPDGRVQYRDFCETMENAFNEPELEKKPTHEVVRPLRGTLAWAPNCLSPAEESHLSDILAYLSDIVRKRRLLLYPLFRDFDRGKGYTRRVTKTQFSRILHFMSLQLTDEDVKVICQKFEDTTSGDVNYSAFIQAIDPEYTGQVIETEKTAVEKPQSVVGAVMTSLTDEELLELIDRIKYFVKINRIRVCEFFQDFDPLKSASITKGQFRQGIDAMGFSRITPAQFESLSLRYSDPKRRDCILWTQFVTEIESVFTKLNLEAMPTHRVTHPDDFTMTRYGARDWKVMSDRDKEVLEDALMRIRERMSQRRELAKPCFQDFDKHNHGYVTAAQFKQCLSCLGLVTSEKETSLIEERFSDDKGVNYMSFLAEVQGVHKEQPKHEEFMRTLQALQKSKAKALIPDTTVNIEDLMIKLKTKVSRERIRVLEFMRDYDKLRTGRMLKTAFPRALDLCLFQLTQPEVDALIARYEYSADPAYVEYLRFSDDIEEIFTVKGLEKAPTLDVHQFIPPVAIDQNVLTPKEHMTLDLTMHRLAERVRVRSIQVIPLFEDYDRVHIGSVSRTQFRRVLNELELSSLVSEHEFKVLYKHFDVNVGGRDDVNYIAFCDMINTYAESVWREKMQ
jgi:Ca2+-binding EF-hand superfamily protein